MGKEEVYISRGKEDTWEFAENLLPRIKNTNVILLQGELGGGKTTFAQGILHALGAEGPFTSPTFVIMKRYELKEQKTGNKEHKVGFNTIYHFDCYRVESRDILNLGWEEIINNPHNLVLVEWPERIENILPKNAVRIGFAVKGEEERELHVNFQ